jgi:O-antigen/teichoic acid export membrane protein
MSAPPPLGTTPGTEPVEPVAPTRGSLGRQAAHGAVLTIGAQLLKIILQVAGVVVLARLLSPGDYGLVAMVTALVGVAEIFRDFGLSAAAVQAKNLSRAQRDNLFWINTAAGAVLAAVVVIGAPLIALLYGRPELVDLARAVSLVFLLNGMTTQYRADLNRHLRFARIAAIDVIAPVVALATAIALALAGAGYWALVAQQLATSFVLLVGAVACARWIPGLPRRREPMGDLLTFGWHLAGSQFLGYLGNNVDSLTIGYRFGPTSLGLYNRAFQLLMTPLGQLRQPTTIVALPVLSRLKDDRVGSDRYVQRGQLALGFTLVAGLGLVVGAAGPITSIFLGARWLEVEPILRLLAAAGMFQTLAFVGYWVYLSHGLTKQLLQYTVITVTIKVCCILIGSHWGVLGVAWGYAIAPALAWPLSFWWLSKKSTISVRGLFAGAGKILVLSAAIGGAGYGACVLLAAGGRWPQLGGAVLAAALVYGAALLVPSYRRDFRGVLEIARQGTSRAR